MHRILVYILSCGLLLNIWSGFKINSLPAAGKIPDITLLNWLVLEPFDNPQDGISGCQGFQRDYLSASGGEPNAHPVAGQKIAGRRWAKYRMENGQLNLERIFGTLGNKVVYAYCEFSAPEGAAVALKLGSDDGIKAWFNGRLVFSHHIHRALTPDEDAAAIELKPGLNRLLLKIDQGNGGWAFTAQLRSIKAEISDWNKIKDKRFQIFTDTRFSGNDKLSLSIATLPSFAVKEPVNLALRDYQGNVLIKQKVVTGDRVTLAVPLKYSGVCRIEAFRDNLASAPAVEDVFMATGEIKQIVKESVIRARQDSKLAVAHQTGEDFAATLTFLADQLEGKVHSSLVTPERNLRALITIAEICEKAEKAYHEKRRWPTTSLRGIRQWAYYSAIDGSCQPYTVYLPNSYNPAKRYNLAVCLHGYSGDDYGAVQQVLTGVQPEDFIVVAPFGRGDMAYASIGEQDVLDVIDLVQHIYSIDPDRVYLTGWSMGGCGTWRIGQYYADRFAAIAPFCGWTTTKYLANLYNMPTLVVHGSADPAVSVEADRAATSRLAELQTPFTYEELPGVDHDAWRGWLQKHQGNQLFAFFRKYRRNRWPDQVELSIPYLRFRRQYWVQAEEFGDPQKPGYIKARVVDSRHMEVNTDNITAFTLDLAHPKLATSGRIIFNINGFNVTADAGLPQATFTGSASEGFAHQPLKSLPGSLAVKHDGGGIADLFTGPLYIVYGTLNPKQTRNLYQAARVLADWRINDAATAGSKLGCFHVKEDSKLTADEARQNNLLLLGTTAENRITAELLSKKGYWPASATKDRVELGAKKYSRSGLVMVYPNPRNRSRLVGIISLPPNTGLYNFAMGLRGSLTQYAMDLGMGSFTTPDLLIYSASGSLSRVGYFDRNWRLKE